MPLSFLLARPSRLTGFATTLALVALPLTSSADWSSTVAGTGERAGREGAGAAPTGWSWPVGPPHPITRQFIAPPTPYAAGHRGIDIGLPGGPGATVIAPADGVVHFAGVVVDRPIVSIQHADGVISSVEPVEPGVARGDPVSRGDLVGTVAGGTGSHCLDTCLHLGVRVHGEYVSPMLFLGDIPLSVLLPTRPVR